MLKMVNGGWVICLWNPIRFFVHREQLGAEEIHPAPDQSTVDCNDQLMSYATDVQTHSTEEEDDDRTLLIN